MVANAWPSASRSERGVTATVRSPSRSAARRGHLLQVADHAAERRGHAPELVAAGDLDALVGVAARDRLGGVGDEADRALDRADEQERDGRGQRQREQQARIHQRAGGAGRGGERRMPVAHVLEGARADGVERVLVGLAQIAVGVEGQLARAFAVAREGRELLLDRRAPRGDAGAHAVDLGRARRNGLRGAGEARVGGGGLVGELVRERVLAGEQVATLVVGGALGGRRRRGKVVEVGDVRVEGALGVAQAADLRDAHQGQGGQQRDDGADTGDQSRAQRQPPQGILTGVHCPADRPAVCGYSSIASAE